MALWTFRRNENDVVNLYNTLSPVMQLATGGNMLNFGYWHKEDVSPVNAQNRLCNKIGELAELKSANSLLDIGSGLSAPAIIWAKLYPGVNISCLNINYIQLQLAKKIVKEKISNSMINVINSTSPGPAPTNITFGFLTPLFIHHSINILNNFVFDKNTYLIKNSHYKIYFLRIYTYFCHVLIYFIGI